MAQISDKLHKRLGQSRKRNSQLPREGGAAKKTLEPPKRLGKSRKLTSELRREAGSVQKALDALKHGATSRLSHGVALDPLHAAYVAVHNLTSVFAERVSQFPEFAPYDRAALHAQD